MAVSFGVNVSLRELLKRALNVQDYELAAPRWLETQRFDVNALVPGGGAWTPNEFAETLKALLVERFHLRMHYAEKVVQG